MNLKTNNFANLQPLTLDLPNQGLILIKGANGAGKTNVLRAIEFALFGSIQGIPKQDIISLYKPENIDTVLSYQNTEISRKMTVEGLHTASIEGKPNLLNKTQVDRFIHDILVTPQEFRTFCYLPVAQLDMKNLVDFIDRTEINPVLDKHESKWKDIRNKLFKSLEVIRKEYDKLKAERQAVINTITNLESYTLVDVSGHKERIRQLMAQRQVFIDELSAIRSKTCVACGQKIHAENTLELIEKKAEFTKHIEKLEIELKQSENYQQTKEKDIEGLRNQSRILWEKICVEDRKVGDLKFSISCCDSVLKHLKGSGIKGLFRNNYLNRISEELGNIRLYMDTSTNRQSFTVQVFNKGVWKNFRQMNAGGKALVILDIYLKIHSLYSRFDLLMFDEITGSLTNENTDLVVDKLANWALENKKLVLLCVHEYEGAHYEIPTIFVENGTVTLK